MSVLNKIPFINNVLDNLGEENLKTLLNLMNGSGDRTELLRTMDFPAGNRTNITTADKGVHMCSLQVGPTLYYGYLLYSDYACVLLSFTDFQTIVIFKIDVANKGLETITEYLDINELRGQVNDILTEIGELGDIVAKMSVTDITTMTKDQLDRLESGDVVNKITGNVVHSYRVSYKGTGTGEGICLTYADASCIETVSYDRSGSNWVYNSTDVSEISGGLPSTDIASAGNVLSLDSDKNPQWSAPAGGGTKLYQHVVKFYVMGNRYFVIWNESSEPIDSYYKFYSAFRNGIYVNSYNENDPNHPNGYFYFISSYNVNLYTDHQQLIYMDSSVGGMPLTVRVLTSSFTDTTKRLNDNVTFTDTVTEL